MRASIPIAAIIVLFIVLIGGVSLFLITRPSPVPAPAPAQPSSGIPISGVPISGEVYQSISICYSDNTCDTRKSEKSFFSFLLPQSSVALDSKGKQIQSIQALEFIKFNQGNTITTENNYQLIVIDPNSRNRNITVAKQSTRTLTPVPNIEYLVAQEQFTPLEILSQAKTLGLSKFHVAIKYNTHFKGANAITSGYMLFQNMTSYVQVQQAPAPAPNTETLYQGNTIVYSPPSAISKLYITKIEVNANKEVYVTVFYEKGSYKLLIDEENGYTTGDVVSIVVYISPETCSLQGTYNWSHDGGLSTRPILCDRSSISKFPSGTYTARLRAIDFGDIQTVSFSIP